MYVGKPQFQNTALAVYLCHNYSHLDLWLRDNKEWR